MDQSDALAAGRAYVARARQKGKSDEDITDALRAAGWKDSDLQCLWDALNEEARESLIGLLANRCKNVRLWDAPRAEERESPPSASEPVAEVATPGVRFHLSPRERSPEGRVRALVPTATPALTPALSRWERESCAVASAAPGREACARTSATGSSARAVRKVGEEITGPDGGVYVWVPAGDFMMGSPDGEGNDDEHPQHRVRISQGLWLSKCEVTNAQYRAFCQATGGESPPKSDQGEHHPVVYVNWEDVKAYCDHYGLRLPTEAEWEYAARGPERRRYPWGSDWDETRCCNVGSRGPGGRTFPVGSFPHGASWCGALDMAGNVEEWCADWYDAGYYGRSPGTDPQGPPHGEPRVSRGGSWGSCEVSLYRSVSRNWSLPVVRYDCVGFRPVVPSR